MRGFCVSIDVERDYRLDGRLTTRGIADGLPSFVDVLRARGVPFDLMVSGEVAQSVPEDIIAGLGDRVALGCHGFSHRPGYLNRMSRTAQERDLRLGTEAVRSKFGRSPQCFRAPNFSANADTIRILQELDYRADSSVLPGRHVRRWRVLPLVDHRGVSEDPFTPDLNEFPRSGSSKILEVPVTPNRVLPGGPLGLGFLHSHGPEKFEEAISRVSGRYVVFLAHSWEMVSWDSSDRVAPWVRSAARSKPAGLENLVAMLEMYEFLNMDEIWQREVVRATG